MLIESLSIENFRQFHGEVKLDFSIDPKKNITVVHGANGSGKTSLLNAFKWCFYDETDFDTSNENILNEAAIQEQSIGGFIDIKITVRFEHDKARYGAIRSQRFRRVKGVVAEPVAKSKFALDVTREDGQTKRSNSPFVELKSILPPDLQPYFFFNGERIEHIAGVNQGVLIRDAIRKLMGIELVDRAITHLDKAKKHYRKLVRESVTSQEQGLHDQIGALEEDLKKFNEKIYREKREEELARVKLAEIERELKKFEKSRDLQERRDALEVQLSESDAQIIKIKEKQKSLMNSCGFLVLSKSMFESCDALIDEGRKKGMLPYGIKEQFIDDRIEIGTCICGTDIKKGAKEHRCLLEVRKTAGTNEIESTYTSVSALLSIRHEKTDNYNLEYTELTKQLVNIRDKNDRIQNEKNEISAQLTHLDDEAIVRLEIERQEYEGKRDVANGDKSIAQHNIKEVERDLEEKTQALSNLEEEKSRQNIANRRMAKTQDTINILSSLRESLSDQVRVDLSGRVDETFQSIIRKPVRAVIDEDYRLQILKATVEGEEYSVLEQSTGERQVTSLSFIASIIALAKEKHAKKAMFFQGGLYPLVMDSPFGTLDPDYRKKVATRMADLAEQVIMFLSDSQWSGQVKSACEGRVGKSYQLVYHSPECQDATESDYIVASDNGFEYSTLKEVL